MSSLVVKVRTITAIRPHKNPEKTLIEVAEVDGWPCIVRKGSFTVGDKVVFIPPDTMLPQAVSDEHGVTNYLDKGRVRSIRLGGEMSFGLLLRPKNKEWAVDTDVAAEYGATKYNPPPASQRRGANMPGGKANSNPRHFHKFTDIENIRHYPHVLDGHVVVCTEKIHGANWRACISVAENGTESILVGSRNTVREEHGRNIPVPANSFFEKCWYIVLDLFGKRPMEFVADAGACRNDWYYHAIYNPLECGQIKALLQYCVDEYNATNVSLYGETYGDCIQNLAYGKTGGAMGFAAIGLTVNYKYVDYDEFVDICKMFGVPTAPLVYRGPYDFNLIMELSKGKSLVKGATNIREGIVVQPEHEIHGPCGRAIFKAINDDYLLGKESGKYSDSTDN